MEPLVAAIGHATLDILGVLPRYPKPGGKHELHGISLQGGGPAATALAAARALGCRARFATRLAGDAFGEQILAGLEGAGIDCAHVVVGDGRLSPLSFIAVAEAERTIFTSPGDAGRLGAREVDLAAFLDGAAVLLVDGHHPEAQIAAAEACRARGVPVVLDAGSVREGMGELCALCDVLIASEHYAAQVAPRGEVEDSLAELAALGPRVVVVTLGAAGSAALVEGRLVRQPAFPVEAVDTTGAGDVFHGAFAAAHVHGCAFPRSLEVAAAAAALSCRALGGRAGLPSPAEVAALLKLPSLWPAR